MIDSHWIIVVKSMSNDEPHGLVELYGAPSDLLWVELEGFPSPDLVMIVT